MFARTASLLAALMLPACSLFAPDPEPETWTRASGDPEQTSADLRACQAQADAVIRRDAAIDQDISSALEPNISDPEGETLTRNMDAFERERRENRIVADCMRGRGYILPEESAFE